MKNILKEFGNNLKIEGIAISFYIGLWLSQVLLPEKFLKNIDLSVYFTQDRLNGIAAFFAITIGVYIAVVTVIATSEIGISKEMLKMGLDKPLINVIIAGMIENLVSVGLSIFVSLNGITMYILIICLTVSVLSFVKFIVLLVVIFKVNLEQMAKGIDADEKYKEDMLTYLQEISRYLKKQ